MKPQHLVLPLFLATLLATGLGAQNFNEVARFAAVDAAQIATHPTTGFALELPGAQHSAYMAASPTGVAAGSLTWVWYPSQLNLRYEDRFVTGHMVATRPSSSTPLSMYSQTAAGQTQPGVPQYVPRFSIYRAKARSQGSSSPFGNGFEPDFSQNPLLTYNTLHTPLLDSSLVDSTQIWTVTYNLTVLIPGSSTGGANAEMIMALQAEGGEHYQTPGSQSLPTGFSENDFTPAHWGWATPGPTRTISYFDPAQTLPGNPSFYSSPLLGYFEDQPTLAIRSSWAENNDPTLALNDALSYNVGNGFCNAASTAGSVGMDVFTSISHSGNRVLPLLNVGLSVHPSGTPSQGQMAELNLADPFVTLFWGNGLMDGFVDANGLWFSPTRISFPALGPATIGTWLGLEYAIINEGTGALVGTTNAYWFQVVN